MGTGTRILLIWLIAGICVAVVFVLLLGYSSSQGGRLPASAHLLALAVLVPGLALQAPLMLTLFRLSTWGPFLAALPALLLMLYFLIAMVLELLRPS